MGATDDELLERWRAGDGDAGQALFAAHFDAIYRFFTSKVGEPDELVQATFLACLRARDRFRGQSTFRTYLFAIARNTLLAHLRGLRRDRQLDPEVSSIADLVTTPGTRLARGEEHRRLVEALRQLPVEQQTLLELHYWEDLDAAALAEVFETTTGAMRVRLHRARQALREKVEALAPREAIVTDDGLDAWARSLHPPGPDRG